MKSQLLVMLLAGGLIASNTSAQDDENQAAKSAELLSKARQLLGQEDYKAATDMLDKLVQADPKNALGWQLHGFALHSAGKLDQAIKSHEKAAGFDQTRGIALYNLACAYSLKKDKKNALKYLEKAVDAKFLQTQYYETDTDLDNIRDDEKFKFLLATVKNGGKKPAPKKEQEKDKKKLDAKALLGTWKVVYGERSGDKVESNRLPPAITITAKQLTIPTGNGDPFTFSYKVDAAKKPVAIDFKITGGPVPEGTALGIMKLEKGQVTLCYDSTGQSRPEKFETKKDDGRFLFKMEKVKKETKEKKSSDK